MTATTLADPMFNSILKENTMDTIDCQTTEEHKHTTLINPTGQPVPNQPIQSALGNSYAPMDTSPQPKLETPLDRLLDLLNATLREIVKEVQKQPPQQTNLEEAVSTALEQADWFRERLGAEVSEYVEEHDFDYEIGNHIERYFRNSFDPSDHFDINEAVKERVIDEVESLIDGLVEEAVEARLSDLVEEKLRDANITINF